MKTKYLSFAAAKISALATLTIAAISTSVQAEVIATKLPQPAHGSLWLLPLETGADDPHPGGTHGHAAVFPPPSKDADVSFTTSIINFASPGPYDSTYTIGGFLSSLGAIPISGPGSPTYSAEINPITHTLVTPSTPIYNELGPSPGKYSAYLEITGDVYLQKGNSILIDHDDGLSLKLNGKLAAACTTSITTQCFTNNAPQPMDQAFERYQWNGPSGLVNFSLVYSEGFGGPAVLKMGVQAVPEPDAYALIFSGLLMVGLLARLRISRAQD